MKLIFTESYNSINANKTPVLRHLIQSIFAVVTLVFWSSACFKAELSVLYTFQAISCFFMLYVKVITELKYESNPVHYLVKSHSKCYQPCSLPSQYRQFHKSRHIPSFSSEGTMAVSYLVTIYVLTLCACQVNVSLTCFSFCFQECLETWTWIYIYVYLSLKNIKVSNTKFLIHLYERSRRHCFFNCFLFLLRRLFFLEVLTCTSPSCFSSLQLLLYPILQFLVISC